MPVPFADQFGIDQVVIDDDDQIVKEQDWEQGDCHGADLDTLANLLHDAAESEQNAQQRVKDPLVHEVLVIEQLVLPLALNQDQSTHDQAGRKKDKDSWEDLELALSHGDHHEGVQEPSDEEGS